MPINDTSVFLRTASDNTYFRIYREALVVQFSRLREGDPLAGRLATTAITLFGDLSR